LKFALTLSCVVVSLAATSNATATRSEYTGITSIRYASAYCESSGNIHAISKRPAGVYRGKWQFDQTTWRAYAPPAWKYADPAYAPEWVQDRAALAVPYDAWPNC
jgi:Transglycosylase-like domain